jgi:VanZ family protein
MPAERPSALARYFFGAYLLLVIYASLHPFSGWHDRGSPLFGFLVAPLPRPVLWFDAIANVIGYVPLGFLVVIAVFPFLRRGRAFALGFSVCFLLSLTLETLQFYLPTRTPSNLDLLTNAVGGALGALAALAATQPLMDTGGLRRLREGLFLPGNRADLGLVLLGLWLFAQLNPETLLFGTGDLRDLFKEPSGKLYPAEVFVRIEAGVACANALAAGLLAACLIAPGRPTRGLVVAFIGAALTVHSFAFGLLIGSQNVLDWVTPGGLYGVAAAMVLLLLLAGLPRTGQLTLAGLALLAAAAIVNLSPPNPYTTATLSLWQQGHYLNFNGLTRVVAIAWPFAALCYLLLLTAGWEQPDK